MGSSLAFSLKEDPVRCAKVCDKSWVILSCKHPHMNESRCHVVLSLNLSALVNQPKSWLQEFPYQSVCPHIFVLTANIFESGPMPTP